MKYDCVFDEALDDGAGECLEGAGGAGFVSFSLVLWMYFSKSVCSSLLEPFASGSGATDSGRGAATAMAAGGSCSASSATDRSVSSDGSDGAGGRRGLGGGSDSAGSENTASVDSGSCTGSSIKESPKLDVLFFPLL